MNMGITTNYNNVDRYNNAKLKNSDSNVEKFQTNHSYELQANSVLSTIRVETGESIGIYYDESSTESNPIMLARVKDNQGNVQEIKVNVNEVDPSNASYVEMISLSAHLKSKGKINGPAGALATMVFQSRVNEANSKNIYEKNNFVSSMDNMLQDVLKNGQMDTYLRYLKELDIYKNWLK